MLTKFFHQRAMLVALVIAFLSSLSTSAFAQLDDSATYTDRLHLKNGDTITGDLKQLDRGKLRFKTLTMDTVYINWIDIESIDSNKYLRVERTDGTFNYGVIKKTNLTDNLVILDRNEEVEIPVPVIASIQPIRVKESFWRRLEGDISGGLDYKKASDILLINLSSSLRFREEKYELDFFANWNETTRTEDNNSSRADIGVTYTRSLRNRWFWKASGGFERNQELGIDLRTIVGGTVGKYFIQTPTIRFELNAGLAGNQENNQDNTTTTSIEGLIRSSLDIFKLSIPSTRLSANINVFPGITESGRLRINTNVSLRNEFIRDLFWDLTFYSTYDNRPVQGAENEDYGVVTSIGASF
jgi:putative salt-induced outer membrane protein YdiY